MHSEFHLRYPRPFFLTGNELSSARPCTPYILYLSLYTYKVVRPSLYYSGANKGESTRTQGVHSSADPVVSHFNCISPWWYSSRYQVTVTPCTCLRRDAFATIPSYPVHIENHTTRSASPQQSGWIFVVTRINVDIAFRSLVSHFPSRTCLWLN